MIRSRSLIDPELLSTLASFPDLDLSPEALPRTRAVMAEWRRQVIQAAPMASGGRRAERWIAGPPGAPDVRVLVYQPEGEDGGRPAILDIHGGGYVMGDPEGNDAINCTRVQDLDCVVVSVAYRHAPETPFPGPLEDCYAALLWMRANALELGVDPARIAIVGGSAGGGLAAGLALLARDRGEVAIIHQQLVAPMLDDRPEADPHPYAGEFVWDRARNRFGWTCLLGVEPGSPDVSPYAAAARADDLAGLPSTFISVGALDLFLEPSLEYARRLTRAGVPVELHVYPGAFHGFDRVSPSRVGQVHARDQLSALARAFHPREAETGEVRRHG